MKNYTRRIRQMGVAVIWTMAIAHELPAQNSTAEVEAHNAFGSRFGNNGNPGGNPGGNPDPGSGTPSQPARTPETFQAAFEVRTGGKQVKQDCAVCHRLSVLINGKEYGSGEAVTLRKGETHTVKVKDTPVPRDTPPGGDSEPPHTSNQKFTVWPQAVDGQTITSIQGNGPADSPQVFIAKKAEILQYLLDNSEGLMAQDKDWPQNPADEPMNKTARLLPVQIEEVSFGGTKYWELKSDDAATTYSAPQWKDVDGNGKPTNTAQGERDYAVAFTRNTKPKIGAKFKIASASNFGAIKIKATGPGGVAIPETSATVSGDEVTLPLTEASAALVNTIKFYDKKDDAKAFKLEWELKIGNSDWSKIATTKHSVYVVLTDPITSLRQESLAELGCRNADNQTAEASARNKMYEEFTDRVVKRLDGKQMTYWLNDQMGCTDTADLLSRADGNGNCQSWSGLFRDVLRFQGIQADRIRVWPQGNDTSVAVKTWTFTEPPHGPANHPYVIGVDATDVQGVPGQGNPNPPGSFNGHWITESGGTYFDPSYGAAVVSGANKGKLYEDSAFAGFGATYAIPNNGGQFDSIRKNDTSAQSPAEVDYFDAN